MLKSDKVDKDTVFDFLCGLRESGKINMFAAPMVLMEQFGYDKDTAKQLFFEWTRDFHEKGK